MPGIERMVKRSKRIFPSLCARQTIVREFVSERTIACKRAVVVLVKWWWWIYIYIDR